MNMVKRNPHFAKLHSSYLFPEITKHKRAFLERNPDAPLISLSIGDTTEPIPLNLRQIGKMLFGVRFFIDKILRQMVK